MKDLTFFQKQLFEKVKKESRQRADDAIKKAKLSAEQRVQLIEARKKLEQASLVLNLKLRRNYNGGQVIDGILELGRTLNRFEIGSLQPRAWDEYLKTRLLVEFKLYGGTSDLQEIFQCLPDEERPHYSALDYLNHDASIPTLRGYGDYRFVLKGESRERSTLTPYGSFFAEGSQVYVWEDVDGILASRPLTDEHFWFEHIFKGTEPKSLKKGRSYIEVQILGGVSLQNDVEMMYYPDVDRLDGQFFQKLKRLESEYGVQLVQYGSITKEGGAQ